MSLCQHGYTAFFDCPLCECPGCGRPQDLCVCHLKPRPAYHGAAGPLAEIEPLEEASPLAATWARNEAERADQRGRLADEIAGGVAFLLLIVGGFVALHLK